MHAFKKKKSSWQSTNLCLFPKKSVALYTELNPTGNGNVGLGGAVLFARRRVDFVRKWAPTLYKQKKEKGAR